LLAVTVAIAVVGVLTALGDSVILRGLETASFDLRLRLRGALPAGPQVALVLVDDRSLAALGRWPFSRHLFARALDRLAADGARVVVFDLLFSEPEQPVSPAVREAAAVAAAMLVTPEQKRLHDALAGMATDDPDADLAEALRRAGSGLLATAFTFAPTSDALPALPADWAFTRFEPSLTDALFPLQPVSALPPIDRLAAVAAGFGHVTIAFDRDGIPRYEHLALPYQADYYPSLSLRAVALFLGLPWGEVGLTLGQGVQLGPRFVPTDRAMRLLINYRGPRGTFPTWSFADLIAGTVPAEAVRDRIVLVGAAATGINDTFRSPFGSVPLPGVERMANVIDTILQGNYLQRPEALTLIEPVAAVTLAGLAGFAVALVPTWAAVLVATAPLALWTAAAQGALVRGWWLGLVSPLAGLGTAMMVVLLYRYVVVDHNSRRVRAAFRHYLAPDLVAEIAAHPERLQLGGETRQMTVLFCDIRNFTGLSEAMAPQVLVAMVNRFFTPMTEIIQRHHGTVDKYIGDCIMAFWNAPLADADHARHACAAALEMLAEVDRLAIRLSAEFPGLPPIAVGIGLNSGPCCVGNVGSKQRFDYSVLGRTVNHASRIEGLSKTYHLPLLAGEGTRNLTPELPWHLVDEVVLRGHTGRSRVYTLCGRTAGQPDDQTPPR
jgi:adenylate cyclase